MLAVLENDSSQAHKIVQQVPVWFEEWEQCLSRFRADSELSRLNRSTGKPVRVSRVLWEVFHASREAELSTGGLVTPAVLDALLQAGYDRSFDALPGVQLGGPDRIQPPLDLSRRIGWDESTRTLTVPESVHLDFGGIAKGWAAQTAMERLAEYGSALVDAGGDIAISGPRPDGTLWPIGINDPFNSGTHFETLRLGRCGVATSGKDYRRWLKDGAWAHHIIDPRSGLPAVTDVLTATLIAQTAIDAEAAAKSVLILGSPRGLEWLEADPRLAGVLVLDDGGVVYSRTMKTYLWSEQLS